MSPTSSGFGSVLHLKHLRCFTALTTSQIFTVFDSWRQRQVKAPGRLRKQPAPWAKIC